MNNEQELKEYKFVIRDDILNKLESEIDYLKNNHADLSFSFDDLFDIVSLPDNIKLNELVRANRKLTNTVKQLEKDFKNHGHYNSGAVRQYI